MINPTSHVITQFLARPAGAIAGPFGIAAGPNGNLWFTGGVIGNDNGYIGEINPTTDAISEFTIPYTNAGPAGITAGPDGNLWFTDEKTNAIGMLNPTTDAITEFALPTAGADPFMITAGPDGNLWFTESTASQIGDINPTTDAITQYALPTANSDPRWITAGPDGNIWFTEQGNGNDKVGTINLATDAITEFATPTATSSPQGITAGPGGNLWFTEYEANNIAEINPTTDAITEFPISQTGSYPDGIAAGPDGSLWFAGFGNASIGAAFTSQLAVTQQPPASVTAGSPFGLTVEDLDSSGNLVSSFDGTVTVALAKNPGRATLGGTVTVTASGGVATFSNLSLTKAASGYTLQVSGDGIASATTTPITVTPAVASQVAITAEPPASVTAGSSFGIQAAIEDTYGNIVTSASNAVSVALANDPTGATLGGTLSVTASNGVATFSGLTLTQAASGYTLQASSSGLSSATSSAMTVTPAAATQLVITEQPPTSVGVNNGFGLQVAIEDTYGNLVTSSSSTVKVALGNNPTGAKLGGTLSVKASAGVATFSGLTLNKAGTGYTLQLTSSGLSSATSSAITVTNSDAIAALSATIGIVAPDPLLAPLVLDSPGFLDSLGFKKHGRAV